RAMMLEFPDDPGCRYLDQQYMLGEALLVAPIFRHDNVVEYYLPAGRWTHFLTGDVVQGGSWRSESYDFFGLPLWVRPNSIIAVGANDSRPDYDFADGVTFHLFGLAEGTAVSSTVPTLQGEPALTLHVQRIGKTIDMTADGAAASWQVLLRGETAVASLSGGTAAVNDQGVLLQPASGSNHLTVQLS
ncbi:MAG: glycoside hydrolase family 31 protein, partial [Chloroflexota bacterium]